ncbi:hypothetical protein SprV_0802588000 [Sparganum proliferum]
MSTPAAGWVFVSSQPSTWPIIFKAKSDMPRPRRCDAYVDRTRDAALPKLGVPASGSLLQILQLFCIECIILSTSVYLPPSSSSPPPSLLLLLLPFLLACETETDYLSGQGLPKALSVAKHLPIKFTNTLNRTTSQWLNGGPSGLTLSDQKILVRSLGYHNSGSYMADCHPSLLFLQVLLLRFIEVLTMASH